jgi:hypothetical protein
VALGPQHSEVQAQNRPGTHEVVVPALFVEVLIAGLEAIVWIGLFALMIAGSGIISLSCLSTTASKIQYFKDWATPVSGFLFAGAYALGIIVDRFADWTYRRFEASTAGKLVNSLWGGDSCYFGFPASIDEMRLMVLKARQGPLQPIESSMSP